jgi:Tfp pilus assembly protein PilF
LEPGYAQAWVGLGVSRIAQANFALLPQEEGWRNARRALQHALTLDPDLAEAYAAMASIQFRHDWDWAGADASFHHALELDPHKTQTLKGAGTLAARLGRLDEAIALEREVIDMDLLDYLAYLNAGTALYYAGRLRGAQSALEKVVELDSALPNAHALLGRIYLAESNPRKGLGRDFEGERSRF